MKTLSIDASKCTGCRTCEVVCSLSHSKGLINPRLSRVRVFRDEVNGVFTPIINSDKPVAYANITPPDLSLRGKSEDKYWLKDLFTDTSLLCNTCGMCTKWCATGTLRMKEE